MTIGEFQFCASAIMGMLSASLVIASRYTNKAGKIYNKSLWILSTGTILLTVHFGLQYYFKFRSNGQMDAFGSLLVAQRTCSSLGIFYRIPLLYCVISCNSCKLLIQREVAQSSPCRNRGFCHIRIDASIPLLTGIQLDKTSQHDLRQLL